MSNKEWEIGTEWKRGDCNIVLSRDGADSIVTLINYRTAMVSHSHHQTERAARRHIGYLLGFAVDYIEGGLK